MTNIQDQLSQAFTDDHKVMMRGFRDLLQALDQRDYAAAARLATKLDLVAGPHIEFEERYLYPAVKESRGEEYVSRLYEEHYQLLSVIVSLQTLTEDAAASDDRIASWKKSLELGLDHAATCGTLLSHLQAGAEQRQRNYLEAIGRLRKQGRRWSEIPR